MSPKRYLRSDELAFAKGIKLFSFSCVCVLDLSRDWLDKRHMPIFRVMALFELRIPQSEVISQRSNVALRTVSWHIGSDGNLRDFRQVSICIAEKCSFVLD